MESEMVVEMTDNSAKSHTSGGMTTDVAADDYMSLWFANNTDTTNIETYFTKLIVHYIP